MAPNYVGGAKRVSSTSNKQAPSIEVEAQQVLDKLLSEDLIPFALNVGKITKGIEAYTIHFHDSRIFTARVPLTKGHSFRDLVRIAVLARVAKMSGPLKK